eukprot:10881191-Karenia_brevis.AAC.1
MQAFAITDWDKNAKYPGPNLLHGANASEDGGKKCVHARARNTTNSLLFNRQVLCADQTYTSRVNSRTMARGLWKRQASMAGKACRRSKRSSDAALIGGWRAYST